MSEQPRCSTLVPGGGRGWTTQSCGRSVEADGLCGYHLSAKKSRDKREAKRQESAAPEDEPSYAVVTVAFADSEATWTFPKARVQVQCSDSLQLDLTQLEVGMTAARRSSARYSMIADFLPDEDGVVYFFRVEPADD